ncbi:uncharacterized protein BDCG_17925 [Blastomyces dermatitidis ER-3]|uniref:Uncharacterized protein n=1 Tax=Ajellomyces dermatitidis (strain ER-3 / ATCC MYA-2586) TaxID=559297 RepID=A0ABX2W134_AJEDR|nr:uncharacterized protein BDCG_17925 [Blastomyces dermatitidis ER-3]OAT03094.1 hypothetical protein BDCG_17925 [Blastomyces dermatitidis ER-3]
MHFIIQNIEKTVLLSKYVNLLTAEMELKTEDQKMQDFKMQINLTEREQQKLFSEKAAERDFKMIIISDEKKKKKNKNKNYNQFVVQKNVRLSDNNTAASELLAYAYECKGAIAAAN